MPDMIENIVTWCSSIGINLIHRVFYLFDISNFPPFTGSFAMWWNTEAARSTPVFIITDRVPKIIHGQAIKTQDLSVKLRPFSLSRPTRQMFRIVSHPGLLFRTLEYWKTCMTSILPFRAKVLLYAPLWQNADSCSNCTSFAAHNYGLVNCRRLS